MCLRHIIICTFLLTSLLTGAVNAASAADSYDVSYLWHSDRNQAELYQQRVARILGANVAKDLKVVTRSGLYGLIYDRQGDSASANRVAKAHSRLLTSKGLEKAAPIRSHNWNSAEEPAQNHKVAAKRGNTVKQKKSPSINTNRKTQSHNLEAALEGFIKQLRKQGKIASDERTGWSVYDFTSGE